MNLVRMASFLFIWWVDYAYQYNDPCKMCQINACERAASQSRLRETRLVLKLYTIRTRRTEACVGSKFLVELRTYR